MRAALFNEPGSITVGDRPDAAIAEPTDAVVRVVLACVCGSDLWYYRGETPFDAGPIGHEFVGVVEEVGDDVRTISVGDFVIAPFAYSDGTCPHCRHGITTACANGGFFPANGDGGAPRHPGGRRVGQPRHVGRPRDGRGVPGAGPDVISGSEWVKPRSSSPACPWPSSA